MYAIIQTGGKQYKVSELDKIKVEKLDVEEGSEISFDVVAVSTDAGFKAGTPFVEGASVKGKVLSNGKAVAGTVYEMMPQDAQKALDHADVILSKGQGNYESLSELVRHIFYAFLCKCDYFTAKFQVPLLTGMLVEEAAS